MAECEAVKKIIPGYIDHSSTKEEIAVIEGHLCVCGSCRADLAALIDRPKKDLYPAKTKISLKKNADLWDWVFLLIGFIVLISLVFLLFKG